MRATPLPVGLDRLERELKNLAEDVVNASGKGTDSDTYNKAVAKYNAKLQQLNKERNKAGLKSVKSIEELDADKSLSGSSTDIATLRNRLKAEQALGNTAKAKELEAQIAEANAMRTASIASPTGKGITQAGVSGYIPNIKDSQPIINEDGTISVVGADKKPIAVGDKNLESVYIVFTNQKDFYERGVKSSSKNIEYRTAEELRQEAFSLSKDNRKKMQEAFKNVGLLPKSYNANGELDRDNAFENAFLLAHNYANQVNYNRLVNGEPLIGIIDAVKQFKIDEGKEPQVQRSISQFSISDGEAEALLEEFYTQALGVRPGKNDIQKFKEIVQKRAARKPRITETTTTTDGSLSTSTSKVLEEGFDASQAQLLARRQAEARPEFAPYQMATTFYDSLLRAAQSPVTIQGPTS
jgi:hypothetical protein